jgi:hypothetical protein
MKVRAKRGVCVGPGRHLTAGDTADLDPATVTFLVSIDAVERVADEPAHQPEPESKSAPDKSGKKEK